MINDYDNSPNFDIRSRVASGFSNYTREDLVAIARTYIGIRYSHQGRSRIAGLDCGGFLLIIGRETGLSDLEELGYASYPKDGRFEMLLAQNADPLPFTSAYPHSFVDGQLSVADLLAFDYGKGVQHVGIVTRWDGRRYWVVDALSPYGVTEHPVAYPFTKPGTTLTAYGVRGLSN